jgi:hypothetical protein
MNPHFQKSCSHPSTGITVRRVNNGNFMTEDKWRTQRSGKREKFTKDNASSTWWLINVMQTLQLSAKYWILKVWKNMQFLGMYAKLWKVTISCLMSVCLSICRPTVRMEQLDSHWMDFHEICYLSIFQLSVKGNQVSFNSDKNNWYFTWRHVYILDRILLSSWNEKCSRQ